MKCVVGDDTGLIKVVDLDAGKVAKTMGQQSNTRRVVSLCWAAPDETLVAAGCNDGVVRLWHPVAGSAAGEIKTGETDLLGVRMVNQSGVRTLVTSHKGGKCGTWKLDEDNEPASCLFDVPGPISVMDTSDINGTVLFGGKVLPGTLRFLHLAIPAHFCSFSEAGG
jgi:WD40 repeat protein